MRSSLAVVALVALLEAPEARAEPRSGSRPEAQLSRQLSRDERAREAASAELADLARRIEVLKRDQAHGRAYGRELEALLARAQELAARLERAEQARVAPGPSPSPDAQELRERADLLRDRADRVAAALAEVERQLVTLRRRNRLSEQLDELGRPGELFVEGASRAPTGISASALNGGKAHAAPGPAPTSSGGASTTGPTQGGTSGTSDAASGTTIPVIMSPNAGTATPGSTTSAPTGTAVAAGTSGTAGTTGTAGTAGQIGTTGTAGTAGQIGTTGTAGTAGQIGTTGTAGTAGQIGTTGTAGAAGQIGTTGAAGTAGQIGTTGAAGTAGQIGTTGAAGTTGPTETTGATSTAAGFKATSGTFVGSTPTDATAGASPNGVTSPSGSTKGSSGAASAASSASSSNEQVAAFGRLLVPEAGARVGVGVRADSVPALRQRYAELQRELAALRSEVEALEAAARAADAAR